MLDVIIVGSGPFGISLASHAVSNNLQYKLFGYPRKTAFSIIPSIVKNSNVSLIKS